MNPTLVSSDVPEAVGITVVEGESFMISDAVGDVRPGAHHGFYHRDTRFLSGFSLEVDGRPPDLLSGARVDPFSARVYLRPTGGDRDAAPVIVERRRFIGEGVHEDLVVVNDDSQTARITLLVRFESDFADLFEVKSGATSGSASAVTTAIRPDEGVIELSGSRRGADRAVMVRVMPETGPELAEGSVTYRVAVPAHGMWRTCVDIVPLHEGVAYEPRCRCDAFGLLENPMLERGRHWQSGFPTLETDDDTLVHVYQRTAADLGTLRISSPDGSEATVVAGGMPWYMTLFGRDSLITGYMGLPFVPDLAVDSLKVLAAFQGTRTDLDSGEEPGKILHELRSGPLSAGGYRSYRSVDATLLFVILAAEAHRWGVAPASVEELMPAVERCLEWALTRSDADEGGFLSYSNSSIHGPLNQAWKDSGDAIQSADGRLPDGPIATVEVQGYLVDALRAGAELLEAHGGSSSQIADLRGRADEIATRIASSFWVDDATAGTAFLALALDGDKRPVDALASNMGHLLWSRAVDSTTAHLIARHLVGGPLFAGWGVRTLASTNVGFVPVSYHRGSIWPHDNALIVHGLARYGLIEPMHDISRGLLRTAPAFGYGLPELFAGVADDGHGFPVAYPAANQPQAWAAAAPLLLLRAWLGLEVDVPHGQLQLSPALPPGIGRVVLRGLAVGDERMNLSCRSDGDVDVDGLPDGLELRIRNLSAAPRELERNG